MVEYGADTREPVLLGEILAHVLDVPAARARRPPRQEQTPAGTPSGSYAGTYAGTPAGRAPAGTHSGGAAPETGTTPP
ncbi:hypothetical protein G3I19_18265 [Streptomyces sp. SID10853]|uniref:hypothetical protein n=1 Tax=Streptomyces sp. SID10853 TaxID=2706028 RepID=UPI0013C1E35A|nr:hypothetical protein [Streptomyces sp. SID10853]NDZ80436.1 hypothetical protein [Streptomyces sp. SID10853]